jgi:hypothetical protein
MTLTTLLSLPSPPTLEGTDKLVRSTGEGPATLDTVTLNTRMLFAIRRTSRRVHSFPVPVAPVPRRLTMTLTATRRNTEMHMPVSRKLLQWKPPGAAG